MAAAFVYCPRCATPLQEREAAGRTRAVCPAPGCSFVHWGNPLPVVGALVEHRGKVILARGRGWPEKFFGLVTGFLEAGETPEAGVLREVKEELSLDAEVVGLIGVYAFELRNELIACWHVRAPDAQEVKLSDELEAWKAIDPDKLRAWEMGTGLAVRDWLKARRR
ncbi:MAG: NUDIX hydrolase [Archangiaceae bacterium]|nr:NUDIX hydrolase [Archangiaceae bacterium]